MQVFGIEAGLHAPGELTISLNPLQDSAVQDGHAAHQQRGEDMAILDAAATRARVNSPAYRCTYLDQNVGLVDPARLVLGLADPAERMGFELHEDAAFRGFETDSSETRVRTELGIVRAPKALVSTKATQGVLRRFSTTYCPSMTSSS